MSRLALPVAFVSYALAALVLFVMRQRFLAEELWGHLPLALYFTLWLGTVAVALRRAEPLQLRRAYLSTLSGVMLGFGFPGYLPAPFLLLFAFVPLLLVQRDVLGTEGHRFGPLRWYAFNAFFLYNFLATFWVTNTTFAAGIVAVVVNSFLMLLAFRLYHWTLHRSPNLGFLALAAFWMSFEFLHYHWDLNWPWLTLGNGFAQFPALVQWYEWTGVFGGTLWILGVNWLAFRWLTVRPKPLPLRPAALILVPALLSLVRYATYDIPATETLTVAAIQPNFEPHYEKFGVDPRSLIDTFTELTLAAAGAGPLDYVIYPETSFGGTEERDPLAGRFVSTLARNFRDLPADYLFTGVTLVNFFAPGEPPSAAARYRRLRDGSREAYEVINGVLQLDLADGDFQTYRKGVFVPGAENFPFNDLLFFAKPIVDGLGGSVAGLGTQPERTVLRGRRAAIAPVICYESVFGEYFTDYVKAGAQAAFVVTNDGWWDNTAGHRQHLYLSSLRAVETRRAIVRAANMGNCAFISQRGEVLARTDYGRIGYLRGEVALNNTTTLYVRFGDVLARLALLLAAMMLLTNVARKLRKAD